MTKYVTVILLSCLLVCGSGMQSIAVEPARNRITEQGIIGFVDLMNKKMLFSVTCLGGKLKIYSNYLQENDISIRIRLDHIFIAGKEIWGDLTLNARQIKIEDEDYWDINLFTSNLLINYYPVKNIDIFCIYGKNDITDIQAGIGNNITIRGNISLKRPYDFDLKLFIDNIALQDVLTYFDVETKGVVTGNVDGEIVAIGNKNLFNLKGKLDSYTGKFGGLKYNNAFVNIDNVGAVVVADGRISTMDGALKIRKEFDLSNIINNSITSDFSKAVSLYPEKIVQGDGYIAEKTMIYWDGWDIVAEDFVKGESSKSSFNMKKKLHKDFMVNLSAYSNLKRKGYSKEDPIKNDSYMELRYRVGGQKYFKMRFKENDEFLGVEHKIKF